MAGRRAATTTPHAPCIERSRMRKTTRALTGLAATAVLAGLAGPAAASPAAGHAVSADRVASAPGSGQSVVAWNRELITLLGTPGLQPATVHPTRSLAILQAAEYDSVVSAQWT